VPDAPAAYVFDRPRVPPSPPQSDLVGRGRYLVETIGACGNCHSGRDDDANFIPGLELAGNFVVEEGAFTAYAPNITPDSETGIGKWSTGEIVDYLRIGMMPDGDFAGSLMADVVTNATGKLNDADLKAIAAYLKSIPAIRHKLARSK